MVHLLYCKLALSRHKQSVKSGDVEDDYSMHMRKIDDDII